MILGGPIELDSGTVTAIFVGVVAVALVAVLAVLALFRALSGRWSVAWLALLASAAVAFGVVSVAGPHPSLAMIVGLAAGSGLSMAARAAFGAPEPAAPGAPGSSDPYRRGHADPYDLAP